MGSLASLAAPWQLRGVAGIGRRRGVWTMKARALPTHSAADDTTHDTTSLECMGVIVMSDDAVGGGVLLW